MAKRAFVNITCQKDADYVLENHYLYPDYVVRAARNYKD